MQLVFVRFVQINRTFKAEENAASITLIIRPNGLGGRVPFVTFCRDELELMFD